MTEKDSRLSEAGRGVYDRELQIYFPNKKLPFKEHLQARYMYLSEYQYFPTIWN